MLTLFTVPKAFDGHIGIIQRNAIHSWTLLRPQCEVILLADDVGTAEAADDLGVRYIPNVGRNEFGTPLLNDGFQQAEKTSQHELLCHVNADIILMSDFIESVQKVLQYSNKFLMTARRMELDVTDRLSFEQGWEENLRNDMVARARLSHSTGIDFWAYTRGLFDNMPPFAVGRIATESWLLYRARLMGADLIDSTQTVASIHQNHDHGHVNGGSVGLGTGVEAQRNRALVGGKSYFFTIRDRTHILTPHGLTRSRDAWTLWRSLRTAQALHLDMPWPKNLAIKAINTLIDLGRDILIRARNLVVGKSDGLS